MIASLSAQNLPRAVAVHRSHDAVIEAYLGSGVGGVMESPRESAAVLQSGLTSVGDVYE